MPSPPATNERARALAVTLRDHLEEHLGYEDDEIAAFARQLSGAEVAHDGFRSTLGLLGCGPTTRSEPAAATGRCGSPPRPTP
jgi:hypothetical protein